MSSTHSKITTFTFADDGVIPNHPTLTMILYQGAMRLDGSEPASVVEQLFTRHGWRGTWRNGIFDFHHYHSTAHEVLAICRGSAVVCFGGEQGQILSVQAGDVALLPAGTGHKRLHSSPDLLVVGAYPPGQQWDLCRGGAGERPQVLENIQHVPLPESDPVYGGNGPVFTFWKNQ